MTDGPDQLSDAIRGAAGLSGVIASLNFVPQLTLREIILHVPGGLGTSYFVGPLVAEYLGARTPNAQAGWAFLTGMFGLTILAVVWRAIAGKSLSDILSLFRSLGSTIERERKP